MKLTNYSLLIIMVFLIGCSSSSNQNKSVSSQCDDFLAIFNHKPNNLVFQYCEVKHDKQAKPAVATYKVTGEQAAVIEQYLIKNFDMPSLYFVCCIWEPIDKIRKAGYSKNEGEYKDPKTNITYYITMGSDETLVTKRQNWSEIPFFWVDVYTYTEEI
ncbi:DUF4952 domain-containing protein [Entomomonas sp. E2T0]|uniref:DUF4952 domain-containing protein n=1 Tax=Entomomonas sp. E2T0 TaxID=2930213 RepID=UPI0022283A8D|nr:DUF4952 domain-containing protein [Entomomonas sp. E2T0]UYZ83275.1 DUF4952 domain-containing protein [Entomomonas sp. E2T0]